ncbi:hypothetical protein ACFX1X_004560 [Malus domestica]
MRGRPKATAEPPGTDSASAPFRHSRTGSEPLPTRPGTPPTPSTPPIPGSGAGTPPPDPDPGQSACGNPLARSAADRTRPISPSLSAAAVLTSFVKFVFRSSSPLLPPAF